MIDHAKHIDGVVRDELAKVCRARGIDPSEAGYSVGGFGAMSVVVTENGPNMMGCWYVMVSLRPLMIGVDLNRVGASTPVPGVLPKDGVFRAIVRELLGKVDEARQAELKGHPGGNGPMDLSGLKF